MTLGNFDVNLGCQVPVSLHLPRPPNPWNLETKYYLASLVVILLASNKVHPMRFLAHCIALNSFLDPNFIDS